MTVSSKTKGVTCPTHVGISLLHSINKKNGGNCNSQPHRSPPEMSQGWDRSFQIPSIVVLLKSKIDTIFDSVVGQSKLYRNR